MKAWKLTQLLIAFLAGARLLWRTDNLAGVANAPVPTHPNLPQGVDRLESEIADLRAKGKFQGDLPSNVYAVFKDAVEHQLNKRFEEARKEYDKLRVIPFGDKTFDLYEHSKVFQFNVALLPKPQPTDEPKS